MIEPAEILAWSWTSFKRTLRSKRLIAQTILVGIGVFLMIDMINAASEGLYWGIWYGPDYGLYKGLPEGLRELGYALSFAISIGGCYWLLNGLYRSVFTIRFQEQQRTFPNLGIRRSAHNGLWLGALSGFICLLTVLFCNVLLVTLGYWTNWDAWLKADSMNTEIAHALVRLSTQLSFSSLVTISVLGGLLATILRGGLAWWQHWVLRFLLWCSGKTPWHYSRMLEEAAQRVLLHKVGGGYRFVHDLFRDYLASLDGEHPKSGAKQPFQHHVGDKSGH